MLSSSLSVRRRLAWLCLAALWSSAALSTGPALAQFGMPPVPRTAAENLARIEEALDEETDMEFIETPLQDVVDFLKDLHNIPIQLDTPALDELGIGTDHPLTMNLDRITLRSALKHLLREMRLGYIATDEVLLITSIEKLNTQHEVAVYNVSTMLEPGESAEALAEVLTAALADHGETARRGGLVGSSDEPQANAPRIVPFKHLLLVRGNPTTHQAARSLLKEMERELKLAPPKPKAAPPMPVEMP